MFIVNNKSPGTTEGGNGSGEMINAEACLEFTFTRNPSVISATANLSPEVTVKKPVDVHELSTVSEGFTEHEKLVGNPFL